MTLESSTTKVHYEGNGSTREFPLPFVLLSAEHVQVIHTPAKGEARTLTDGYAVCDLGIDAPYIHFPVDETLPALAFGERLTLLRVLPLVQQTDLENGGLLDAEILERQFDILVMQIQQLAEELARTPKLAASSLSTQISVEEIYRQVEAVRERAESAARRAEAVAEEKSLFEGVRNLAVTWEEEEGRVAGQMLTLPVHYIPGRNLLSLYMDGVLCAGGPGAGTGQGLLQYEESGEELSHTVRLLFAVPRGAVWHARVVASNLTMLAREEIEAAGLHAARLESLTAEAARLLGLLGESPLAPAGGKRTATLYPAGGHAPCQAGEAFAVPPYIVGAGELVVFLDGLLCMNGADPALYQYCETGEAGAVSSAILWHDALPADRDIVVFTMQAQEI
jgi:hypothetical protein